MPGDSADREFQKSKSRPERPAFSFAIARG